MTSGRAASSIPGAKEKRGYPFFASAASDGVTSIDQTWYDKAMRWVDPDWWEKHPNGGKDSLNFEDALKAIMKATGAKMDKKDKDNNKKEGED